MHILWKFQPKRTEIHKAAYLAFMGVYGRFRVEVDLFSAQNCYITHLLFDYAHSVKISAQTDQNSQSGLFSEWAFLCGFGRVDLFSAQNCYTAHLLFDYAHSVKISAQTDQNSQSGLFSLYGRGWHFWPKIVILPIYFLIMHVLWKFQPKWTKIHKMAYLAFMGGFRWG